MWNFAATSRLSFTAAGRVDALSLQRTGLFPALIPQIDSEWNRSFAAFSANLGAVYKLTSEDTLRAAFARGVQVPTLVEYGALSSVRNPGPPPGGLALAGNPSLAPTIVTNYEVSEDHALTRLHALIGVKVFYQQNSGILGKCDLRGPLRSGNSDDRAASRI
jgi:iron complex outermembrane receptor protein